MNQNNTASTQNSFPWKEIFGFFGMILAAYIGYLGARAQIEIPIQATQTAVVQTQTASTSRTFQSRPEDRPTLRPKPCPVPFPPLADFATML